MTHLNLTRLHINVIYFPYLESEFHSNPLGHLIMFQTNHVHLYKNANLLLHK